MAVGDSGYLVVTHTALAPLGGTWEVHHSGFDPSITLYAVAYAGDTLHAAIGGSNGSLASTTDGGTTWHTISLGTTTAAIRALTWNKNGVLVGVGDEGLVIRSTDLGQSWKTIPPATPYQLNAISFGTSNDAVAVGNDTAIVQTHDAGLTWSPMAFPYNFHTMWSGEYDTYIKENNFTAVAMTGHDSVWVDLDGPFPAFLIFQGDTVGSDYEWDSTGTYVWKSSRNTSLLYVANARIELASFTASDYLAAEGGSQNWNEYGAFIIGDANGTTEPTIMRFYGSAAWAVDTTVLIVAVGEDFDCMDYVWTPNASDHQQRFGTWAGLHIAGANGTNFLDVNILPNGYGYAVGTEEVLQRTTDSGRTWTKLTLPITSAAFGTTDSAINSVYTLDSSSAIIVGWNGIIYIQAPTGAGFRGVGLSQQERLEGITFPSIDTGIIVGDLGTILQSTDRGSTWNAITTPTSELLYSVAFANDRIGIATGDSAEVLRTTDEGVTWSNINSVLTGTNISIRQVQAFPDGTVLARAGASLLRSTDFGQNWNFVDFPLDVGDSAGMSFYSPQIGICASRLTSSALVPDTAYFAYTTDGGTTWPQFSIPMWAYNQIIFHWLSDHEVLLYGIDGFIEDVTIGESGVSVTRVDNAPQIQVYPNPSSGQVRVDYTTKASGPVSIELWDETGKKLGTLFSGEEAAGAHEQTLTLPTELHGTFLLRLSSDGTTTTSKLNIH